jgi:hypothetical protein
MSPTPRRWKLNALALLVIALSGCVASDGAYVVGGVYEPGGYEYGGWGGRYHVAPSRLGERRVEHSERVVTHAYRPAAPSRPSPSIPSRSRGR